MISQLIEYGAVATKVKAMYAKRLMPEDFQRIASLGKVSDVVSFLKGHPGWRGALRGQFDESRRGPLEAELRHFLLDEYLRILRYIGREDRFIMYNSILLTEMEQIMLFLRYARAGRAADYRFEAPPFFTRHSRIHFDILSKASTYEGMLAAVRDTSFYAPLARLPLSDDGFPIYTEVEVVMRSHYFRELMDMVEARYRGRTLSLLKESVGMEVDLINITTIMRVRRFSHGNADDVLPMLLPVRHKLKPAFINQLYMAPSDEEALALLRSSPYGKVFSAHDFTHIEEYYYQYLYEFNRKAITSGTPSIYTPVAYLSLRQVELKNLVNSIEFVRYGVQSYHVPDFLFGVPHAQ